MKKLFSLGLMLVALTLMNCSKEEIATEAPAVNGAAFELFASTEDGRTANDGWSTVWAEGDQITVIHAENDTQDWVQDTPEGAPFTIADLATGRFTGTLQAELDAESYDWYLFYPYNDYIAQPIDLTAGFTYIGSRSDRSQAQTGINNLTHIAGSNYPLYGKVTNVAVGEIPSVTMHNVSSLVEFAVTNTESEAIAISEIQFTSTEDIVGSYYIDFGGDELGFTPSRTDYVSSTAKLSITDATIEAGATAKFYMAVKPHTVTAGDLTIKVTTDAGACTKTLEGVNTTFKAGLVKTIGFNYEAQEEEKFANGTYVIVATNANKTAFYAMSGANEGTSSSASKRRAYVDVTSDFDATAASYMTDNDALKWEIAATTGGYTISQDGKYLTCDSGNNYALMDTEPYLLTITAQNDGIYQISSAEATNRILAKNQNSANGFAFYTGSGYNDIYIVPVAADTRTALATPTVTATAEEQTITVSWTAVENAGSYKVTCGTKEQTINAPTTTCSFENLDPGTTFTVSVVAKPSDTTLHKDSAAGTATAKTDEAEVSQEAKVLTFEFTQAKNAGWPTAKANATNNSAQAYNNGEYIFTTTKNGDGIYQNSSYLMMNKNEFLGLPIVEGY
ncbi:MAG: fibronectin type III domain-containing protein, partial [Alistipes sp.]|nr:fibronectin type III domain-containing protein [Alistipes sp.]